MNATELAKKLNRSRSWVVRHQHELRHLENRKRIGSDRYSAVLVEKHQNNQPVSTWGAGSRKLAKAS